MCRIIFIIINKLCVTWYDYSMQLKLSNITARILRLYIPTTTLYLSIIIAVGCVLYMCLVVLCIVCLTDNPMYMVDLL